MLLKLTSAGERLPEFVSQETPKKVVESIEAIEIPLRQKAPKQEKVRKKIGRRKQRKLRSW